MLCDVTSAMPWQQVLEALTKRDQNTPVVISNNTPATVIESPDEIISMDSPRGKVVFESPRAGRGVYIKCQSVSAHLCVYL